MKILVIPGNTQNAKSYPYWEPLLALLKEHEVRGVASILKEQQIMELINWCDVWITIDSFAQHLAAYHKLKRGIVLWGKSDPLIFGYPHNVNLLKDRQYLRPQQFKWWVDEPIDPAVFVSPDLVLREIGRLLRERHETPD
jgi:ADP-heptose:LPS heptosyltransferase